MADFKEEKIVFEKWAKKQFKLEPVSFSKTTEGYADEVVNAMFISFCAGWMLGR